MYAVTSRDGTRIGCQVSGSGPPLVLVHGATGTAAIWALVSAQLSRHFTVYAMDRRGRGASGDGPDYTLEREIEDVAAVVSSLPGDVDLLGYSFGGVCALEAALRVKNLRRLILYEPGVPVPGRAHSRAGLIERLEQDIEAGESERAASVYALEALGMPPEMLDRLKAQPGWADRVALFARTVPREMRTREVYRFDTDRFKSFGIPTLLLVGSESPEGFKASADLVASAIRGSRLEVLQGHRHFAHNTAPELFAAAVLGFLVDPHQGGVVSP